MKKCKDCKVTKKPTDFRFHKRNSSTGGFYSTQCRSCLSANKKIWVELNWHKVNESNKQYNRRNAEVIRGNKLSTYWPGTDWRGAIAKYNELLAIQDGGCGMCRRKETRTHRATGTVWDLAVDHCHKTGRVRGLLCNRCNRGLGLLDDSVEGLERAIDYLKKAA